MLVEFRKFYYCNETLTAHLITSPAPLTLSHPARRALPAWVRQSCSPQPASKNLVSTSPKANSPRNQTLVLSWFLSDQGSEVWLENQTHFNTVHVCSILLWQLLVLSLIRTSNSFYNLHNISLNNHNITIYHLQTQNTWWEWDTQIYN